MPVSLLSYCTAFGLSAGAGSRAGIAGLALGLFHYTPYFELSETFAWLASPAVLVVLGLVAIVESLADAHPEMSQLADLANVLPKIAVGFIAFAAATGTVDTSLVELGASGLLGAGTAMATHVIRTKARNVIRGAADLTHDGLHKTASVVETGWTALLTSASFIIPIIIPALLIMGFVFGYLARKKVDQRRISCIHPECGGKIRPGALVCMHCKQPQVQGALPAAQGS